MSDPRASPRPGMDRILRSRKNFESEFDLFFSSNKDGSVSPNLTLLTELLRREGALTDGNKLCRVSGTYLTEQLIVAVVKLNKFTEIEIYKWICACSSKRIMAGEPFFNHIYKIVGEYDRAVGGSVMEKQKYLERARSRLFVVPSHLEVEKPKRPKQKIVRNEAGLKSVISKRIKLEETKVGADVSQVLNDTQPRVECSQKPHVLVRKSDIDNPSSHTLVIKTESEESGITCTTKKIYSGSKKCYTQSNLELGLTSVHTACNKPSSDLHASLESSYCRIHDKVLDGNDVPSRLSCPSWVCDRISKSLSGTCVGVSDRTSSQKKAPGIPFASPSVEVISKVTGLKKEPVACDIGAANIKNEPVSHDNLVRMFSVISGNPDVLITPKVKDESVSGDNPVKAFGVIDGTVDVGAPKVKGSPVCDDNPVKAFGVTGGLGMISGTPDVLDRLGKYGISVRVITEGSRNTSHGLRSSAHVESRRVSMNHKAHLESEIQTHNHENPRSHPDVVSNLSKVAESQNIIFGIGKGSRTQEFQGILGKSRSEVDTHSVTVSQVKLRGDESQSGVSYLRNQYEASDGQIVADRSRETAGSGTAIVDGGGEECNRKFPAMKGQMKGQTVSITVCRKVVKRTLKSHQNDPSSLKEVTVEKKDALIVEHEKFRGSWNDTFVFTHNDEPHLFLQDRVNSTKNEIQVQEEGSSLVKRVSEEGFQFDSSDGLTTDSGVDFKLPANEKDRCSSLGEGCLQDTANNTFNLQKKYDIQGSEGNKCSLQNLVIPKDLDFEAGRADPYDLLIKHSVFDSTLPETRVCAVDPLSGDEAGNQKSVECSASDFDPPEEADSKAFLESSVVSLQGQISDDKSHNMNESAISDGISSIQDNVRSFGLNDSFSGDITDQRDVHKDPKSRLKEDPKIEFIHMHTMDNAYINPSKEQDHKNNSSDLTVVTSGSEIVFSENDDIMPQNSMKDMSVVADPAVLVKEESLSDSGISVNQSQSHEHTPANTPFGSELESSSQDSGDPVIVTDFCIDSPSGDKVALLDTKMVNLETDFESLDKSNEGSLIEIAFKKIADHEGSVKDTDSSIWEAHLGEKTVVYDPRVEKVHKSCGEMAGDEGSAKDTDDTINEFHIGQKTVGDGQGTEKVSKDLEVLCGDERPVKDTDIRSKEVHNSQNTIADSFTAEKTLKLVARDKGAVKDIDGGSKEILRGQGTNGDGPRTGKACEDYDRVVDERSLKDKDCREVPEGQKTVRDGPRIEKAPGHKEVVVDGSLKDKGGREVSEDGKPVGDGSKTGKVCEGHEEVVDEGSRKDKDSGEVPKHQETVEDSLRTEEALYCHENLLDEGSVGNKDGRDVIKDQNIDREGVRAEKVVDKGSLEEKDVKEVPKDQKTVGVDSRVEKVSEGYEEVVSEESSKDKDSREVPKDQKTVGDGSRTEKVCEGDDKMVDEESLNDKDGRKVPKDQKSVEDGSRAEKACERYEEEVDIGSMKDEESRVSGDQKTAGDNPRTEVHGHEFIYDEGPQEDIDDSSSEVFEGQNTVGNSARAEVPKGHQASQVSLKISETQPGNLKVPEVPQVNSNILETGEAPEKETEVPGVQLFCPEISCSSEVGTPEVLNNRKVLEAPEPDLESPKEVKLPKTIPGSPKIMEVAEVQPSCETTEMSEVPMGCSEAGKTLDVHFGCHEISEARKTHPGVTEWVRTPEVDCNDPQNSKLTEAAPVHPETVKAPEVYCGRPEIREMFDDDHNHIVERAEVPEAYETRLVDHEGKEPAEARPRSHQTLKALTCLKTLGTLYIDPDNSETVKTPEVSDDLMSVETLGAYPDRLEELKADEHHGSSEEVKVDAHFGSPEEVKDSAHPGGPEELKRKADHHPESPEEKKTSAHTDSPEEMKAGAHTGNCKEIKTEAHHGSPEELKASAQPGIPEEMKENDQPGSSEVKVNAYPGKPEEVKAHAYHSSPEVKIGVHIDNPEEIKVIAHPGSPEEMQTSAHPVSPKEMKSIQVSPAYPELVETHKVHLSLPEGIKAPDISQAQAAPMANIPFPGRKEESSDTPAHLITSEVVKPTKNKLLGVPKVHLSTPESMESLYDSSTLAAHKAHINPEAVKSPKNEPAFGVTKISLRTIEAVEVYDDSPNVGIPRAYSITPETLKNTEEEPSLGVLRAPSGTPKAMEVANDLTYSVAPETDFQTSEAVKSFEGKPVMGACKAHISTTVPVKLHNDLPTLATPKSCLNSPALVKSPEDKATQGALKAHLSTPEAMKMLDDLPAMAAPKAHLFMPEAVKPPEGKPAQGAPKILHLSTPEEKDAPVDSPTQGTCKANLSTPEKMKPSKDSPTQGLPKTHQCLSKAVETLHASPTLAASEADLSTPEAMKVLEDKPTEGTPNTHQNIIEAEVSYYLPELSASKVHIGIPFLIKSPEDKASFGAINTHFITPEAVKPPKDSPIQEVPKAYPSPPGMMETVDGCTTFAACKVHLHTTQAVEPSRNAATQAVLEAHHHPPETIETYGGSPELVASEAHPNTPEKMEASGDSSVLAAPNSHFNTPEAGEPSKNSPSLAAPKIHLSFAEEIEAPKDSQTQIAYVAHFDTSEVMGAPDDLLTLIAPEPHGGTTEEMKALSKTAAMVEPKAHCSTTEAVVVPGCSPTVLSPKADFSTLKAVEVSGNSPTMVSPRVHLSTLKTVEVPGNSPAMVSPKTHLGIQEVVKVPGISPTVVSLKAVEIQSNSSAVVSPTAHHSTQEIAPGNAPTMVSPKTETHHSTQEPVGVPSNSPAMVSPKTDLSTPETVGIPGSSPSMVSLRADLGTPEVVIAPGNLPTVVSPKTHHSIQEAVGVPGSSPTVASPKALSSSQEAVGVTGNSSTMVPSKAHESTQEAVGVPGNSSAMVSLKAHLINPETIKPYDNSAVVPLNPGNVNVDSPASTRNGKQYHLAHNSNPGVEGSCPEVSSVGELEDTQAKDEDRVVEGLPSGLLGVKNGVLENGGNSTQSCQASVNKEPLEPRKDCNILWEQRGQELSAEGKDVSFSGLGQDGESAGPGQVRESAQKEKDRKYTESRNEKDSAGPMNDGECSSPRSDGESAQPSSSAVCAQKRNSRESTLPRNVGVSQQSRKEKSASSRNDGDLQEQKRECESRELKKDYESPEPKKDCDSPEPSKDCVSQMKRDDTFSRPKENSNMPLLRMEYVTSEPGNDSKTSRSGWDGKTYETKKDSKDSGSLQDYDNSGPGEDCKSSRPLRHGRASKPKDYETSRLKNDFQGPGKECRSSGSRKDCSYSEWSKDCVSLVGKDDVFLKSRKESDFSDAIKDHGYSEPVKAHEPVVPRKSSLSRRDGRSSRPKNDHEPSEPRKDCDFRKSRKDRESSVPKKDYESSGVDKGYLKDKSVSGGRGRSEYERHGKSFRERKERESCERNLERSCQEDNRCHLKGSSRPKHSAKSSEVSEIGASFCQKGSVGETQNRKMSLKSKEDLIGRSERKSGNKRERSRGRDREEMENARAEKPYEEVVKKLKRTEEELQQWKIKCKEQSTSAECKREIEELKLVNEDLQKAKSVLSDRVSSMKERIGVQKAQIQTLSEQLEGLATSAKEREVEIKVEKLPSPSGDCPEQRCEAMSPDATEAFYGWHEDQIKSNRAFMECTGFALKSAIASLQKRQNASNFVVETKTEFDLDDVDGVPAHDASRVSARVDAEREKDIGQIHKENRAVEVVSSCSSTGVIQGRNFEDNGSGNPTDYDPLVEKPVHGSDSFSGKYPEKMKKAHVTESTPFQRAGQGEEIQENGVSSKAVKVEVEQEPKIHLDSWTEPEAKIHLDNWTQSSPLNKQTCDPGKIEELENRIKEVQSENDKLVHKIKEHEDQLAEKEIGWLKILWDKEVQIKMAQNSKTENVDAKEKVDALVSDNCQGSREANSSDKIKCQDPRKLKERYKFSEEVVAGSPCEELKTPYEEEKTQGKRKASYASYLDMNSQGKKKIRMNTTHETDGTEYFFDDSYIHRESDNVNYEFHTAQGLTQPGHDTPEDGSKGENSKSSSQGYAPHSNDAECNAEEQAKELWKLRAEVQQLKEQLEGQKAEFETARRQIQILEDQLELRSTDRNVLKQSMKLQEQHTIKVLKQYEQSLKGKNNQIQVLQATINKMKEQLEGMYNMQKDFAAREKGFKENQTTLQKKVNEANGCVVKKQEQIALLQTQVASFRKQLEEKTKALKEKDMQASIKDALNQDHQKQIQIKNISFSETIEKLESQLSKLGEEMKELGTKASKKEAEALSAKIEKESMCKLLAAKEKELKESIRDRQRERETVTKKDEELRNSAQKREELMKSLSSVEEKEHVLMAQLRGRDDELKKLTHEMKNYQKQFGEKEEELKTAFGSVEKMREELESSQREHISYQEEASNLKRKLEEQMQKSESALSTEREKLCKLKEKYAVEMKAKKKLQNELYTWRHKKLNNVRVSKNLQEELKRLKEVAQHNQTCYEVEKEHTTQLSDLLAEETGKSSHLKNQLISMDRVAEELRRLLKAEQDECIDQMKGQLEIFCATTDRYRCQKDRIDRILNNPVLQFRTENFQEEDTC